MPRPDSTSPPVNGETYFFRDHGQFDLLRLHLLPELIERRRFSKTLRVWSAGCASGEEAYSLAMLVDRLMPRRDGWDILILGVDRNPAALAKAERGRYGHWSFRMAPPKLRQHYFRRSGDEWELSERIRRMVIFRAVDLVGAAFPDDELRDMDLILCRNVFIYFDRNSVATVAKKLAATLREGGYLMTGHTELIGHAMTNMRSRLFAEGVVYQRIVAPPASVTATLSPGRPAPAVARAHTSPREPSPASPDVSSAARSADDLSAAARQFADCGDYARAEQTCGEALAMDPLSAEVHFLLAQVAQLNRNFEQARPLLEKTLYLDPRNIAAHLELAALCERADNMPRAQALRKAALDIVRALPADAIVAPYETTAEELARWLA